MSLQTSERTEIKWLAILRATEEIITAAKQERWTDLPLQAQYRDKLIREYFSKPLTVDNAMEMQDQITRILALDERVLGLARSKQDETKTVLNSLRTGTKAVKAYNNS